MIYTVGEMAQKLGVPASTLRYYDKEGLLPFVERSSGGIRMFRENDFEWLQVIRCMKKAGMSIKDIRQYIELSMQGDDTIDTRLEMFRHQREVLTQQIQQLQHTLETVGSGISGRCSPSRSRSYSTRWRPWSINAGSMKPPKPLGQWMSPVR